MLSFIFSDHVYTTTEETPRLGSMDTTTDHVYTPRLGSMDSARQGDIPIPTTGQGDIPIPSSSTGQGDIPIPSSSSGLERNERNNHNNNINNNNNGNDDNNNGNDDNDRFGKPAVYHDQRIDIHFGLGLGLRVKGYGVGRLS